MNQRAKTTTSPIERCLGDIAKVLPGQSPDSRTYNEDGVGLPFLQGNAEFGTRYPANRLFCTSPARVCEVGDVLISIRAPVGALNQADKRYAIGRGLAAVRFDPQEQAFGWHLLRFSANKLSSVAQGSTFTAVGRAELESLPVTVFEKSHQSFIARILDTLDQAIEQTEALFAKQQQIGAGLMQDLLTYGLDPKGRLRDPSSHLFKQSSLGNIPGEWSVGSLLDVTDPRRQPILTGPFGADLGTDDFVDDGVPVLRIGNVQHGALDLSDLLFVTQAKAERLGRYRVRNGDLLFARQGATTGRNALTTREADGFLINYHIIRIALDHSRCAPSFIEALFKSEIVKRQVDREKGRSTREGINTAQLRALKIPLATLHEQRSIARILQASQGRITNTALHAEALIRLRAGLMQDLLTGRVPAVPLPEIKSD